VKIVADRSLVAPDFALIPTGSFNMGDSKDEGLSCEVPVHSVNVSAFYAARYEVTKALWDDVVQWATNHGYSFEHPGVASATNLPIQQVSWYDAVKWCNARSEKEGFAPAYFTDFAWKNVYRSGEVDLPEQNVRWQGAGYRLPTEAEWEKAARGGLSGKRFPFGDTITQSQADYWTTLFESFDVNGTEGPHPLAPQFPNTLPVGSFAPTGYGLYDMAGNTWEWCWDYYGDTWYGDGRATLADTHGPSSASWGGDRVYRGGSGVDNAWKSRVANRADAPPRFAMGHFGFRVILPAGGNLISAESAVFSLTP
jgi:formylglycine-generating enzyme required for sulfatase activity